MNNVGTASFCLCCVHFCGKNAKKIVKKFHSQQRLYGCRRFYSDLRLMNFPATQDFIFMIRLQLFHVYNLFPERLTIYLKYFSRMAISKRRIREHG